MPATDQALWLRKASLLLFKDGTALDLSEFHFTFKTAQTDESSPNNASIRVFNLKPETVAQVKGEYSEVILQAGYESNFAVIFRGTIKQYRVGRERGTDTYLDILAADGDIQHNFGFVSVPLPARVTPQERVEKVRDAMGLQPGYIALGNTGGILPRGKVLFGMGRALLDAEARSQGCTWSIQNGTLQMLPLDGYLPGQAVQLNAQTGLIDRVEQTEEGMKCKCLLNPRLTPGVLVEINNASINQTTNTSQNQGNVPYNQWAAIQLFASTDADGLYRVYVVEHEGDTRGTPWYSNIVCLSVNPSTLKVKPYG